MNDVGDLVQKMQVDWRVLSMTDLVLNHTSKDSTWLLEHPECSYNMRNTPHLRPAYIVDRILHHFSHEVGDGKWEADGVPAVIDSHEHLMV